MYDPTDAGLPNPVTPPKAVPWVCKTYDQVVSQGLLDRVKAHCQTLDDKKRREYLLFLKHFCDFPKDFA
jgi:hypothetical protein